MAEPETAGEISEPQKRLAPSGMGLRLRRAVLLDKAAGYLGQERAAAALGIKPRSLRAKINIARGVRDDDLQSVATALDEYAATLVQHAATIRSVIAGDASC